MSSYQSVYGAILNSTPPDSDDGHIESLMGFALSTAMMQLSKAQRKQVLAEVEQEIDFRRVKRNAEQAA